MLENEDIQHILLTRTPALTGRYEFLSFRNAAGGRAWLSAILETVQSAAAMQASVDQNKRWVTVAFTWNGLRALGVDEASLATFPEEFRQGMVARAEMLGDTGENHPDNWVDGLASPDLHAIAILFARDGTERLAFSALVTTVAICEEFIYRGFAQYVFQDWSRSLLIGILGSALLFSFAHLYQGKRGLVSTFAVGLLFSGIRAVPTFLRSLFSP